jgi:hypothetical protein
MIHLDWRRWVPKFSSRFNESHDPESQAASRAVSRAVKGWAPSRQLIASLILVGVLLLSGCNLKPPSQFAQAQQESTQKGAMPAVAKGAEQGSEFNQFFPKPAGYDRVFSQEKKGFAEAKLKKGGKDVAMMSISDMLSVPNAASKFANSTTQVKRYPSVEQGTTITAVMVDNRYQVKVISRDPSFTKTERVAMLGQFNLDGLAKLK